MSKAIAEIAIGVGLVALDIFAPEIGIPATLAQIVGAAGAGLVLSGIGTLLKKQQVGLSANSRNPIQPWNVVYGRARIGGTAIYIESTGSSDKYMHTIYVLACHPCHSIDAVLFDSKRICLDTSGNSLSFGGSTSVVAHQQTVNISTITRVGDVVTVILASAIGLPASTAAGPALMDGDTLQIQNVTTDQTLNGLYQIQVLTSSSFTYICGGNPASISSQGQAVTTWPDYGDTVHVETALGAQSSGSPPFPGLLASGDTGSNGLWTANHLLLGRTAVYVRLKYGGETYASGVPGISFLISGKNDIYDPRTSTHVYSQNAALCIADFLTQQVWGFKCSYATDVPYTPLIAAANICDESVTLANGGTEARYSCNGSFQVAAKRGEILQNLLTACGGRITYSGGQYVIWPAAWMGVSLVGPSLLSGNPSINFDFGNLGDWSGGTSAGGHIVNATSNPYSGAGSLQTVYSATFTITLAGGWAAGFSGFPPTPGSISTVTVALQAPTGSTTIQVVLTQSAYQVSYNFPSPIIFTAGQTWTAWLVAVTGEGTSGGSCVVSVSLNGAGALSSPTGAIPAALAGPFQWKPKLAVRDLYNGVKATYVSPLNSWQASDMPPYAQDAGHGYSSDANLTADGGDRRWLDIQLPFTISVAAAQRLAKIELLRRRYQGMGTFAFNLAMYQVTALDVVSFTLPLLGWSNKLLEVTSHRFTATKQSTETGEAMVLGTELDLQETDPSVYSWSASEELSPVGYQQAAVNNIQTIATPTGVTAASGSTVAAVGSSGVATSRIQVSWTAPTDGYVTNGGYTIVQYQIVGATSWTPLGTFDPSVATAYITGVTDGTQYYVRVAFVNAAGVQSAWTQYGPITASGGSTGFSFADTETPGGALNGTNQTFTLAHSPSPAASLELYLNGDLQLAAVDYTLSVGTITMLIATPNTANGDWLRASYRY